jgi:ribonuclease-3
MIEAIQERLGYRFRDVALLETALTHRSRVATRTAPDNERLELLGDAVLALAVTDLLMARFPEAHEGALSKLRASLVNAANLGRKARELGLGAALRLGKGEEKSGGREKESILAAAYEAVLGAIYLDRGFSAARRVLARHFAGDIRARVGATIEDAKTRLQEVTQRLFRETPTYTLVRETGPDHAKSFVSQISAGGRTLGRGEGMSKKSAEQAAAMEALRTLQAEAEALVPEGAAGGEGGTAARAPSSRRGGRR